MGIEDFNEARHVGTLEFLRQANCHAERCHSALRTAASFGYFYRMANRANPNLIDRNVARVG